VEWLGETVRQTDSSLLDEWEALADPAHVRADVAHHAPPPPPRPISRQERPFRVMVRNAMFRRVELVARDDLDGLMALERANADRVEPARTVVMTRSRWDEAIEEYYAEHDRVGLSADARSPKLLEVEAVTDVPPGVDTEEVARLWRVGHTIDDPAGDHDWVVEATVDLDASDEVGEAIVVTTALRRL
jgi:hypothetical protein